MKRLFQWTLRPKFRAEAEHFRISMNMAKEAFSGYFCRAMSRFVARIGVGAPRTTS
jgi:hypothetical protein